MKYAAKLKSASGSPDAVEPDAATLSTDPVTPTKSPSAGTLGPKDKSPNAQPGTDPENKGDGSANGCAVIGGGHAGFLALFLGFLIPVFFRRRGGQ